MVESARKKGKPALPPINQKEKPVAGGVYEQGKAGNPFPKKDKQFPNGKN